MNQNHKIANITYRKLEEKDLADRVRWFNNPSVSAFLGSIPAEPVTLSDQQKWFGRYQADDDKHFIIEVDGTSIGQVALIETDLDNKIAQLFIFIGEDEYRNKGYAQEAMKYICDYGFKTMGLHKIGLEVSEMNLPAIRAYEKFGFKEEARLKEQLLLNGAFVDEIVMAVFNT